MNITKVRDNSWGTGSRENDSGVNKDLADARVKVKALAREKSFKTLQETIAETQVWLDSYPEKSLNYRRIRKEGKVLLDELKISWEAEICKLDKNEEDANFLNQEKLRKESLLMQTKGTLKEAVHQDKLIALISEQPIFAEALRGQVKAFVANRFSGLSFESDHDQTDDVTKGILTRMEQGRDFSPETVAWRGAKAMYLEQLKEICDKKLRGQTLTSQDAHKRFKQINDNLNRYETSLFK